MIRTPIFGGPSLPTRRRWPGGLSMQFYDQYADIKRLTHQGLRSHVRSIALDGLAVLDRLKDGPSLLRTPRVQFIYIHHTFRDEEDALDRLITELGRHHRFISYSEAVDRVLTGRIDAPYVTISSDDGFKNNVRAAEILQRHGAPACFFINPDLIGERSYEVIKAHCRQRLHFPPVEFMDWDEVAAVQAMGHEIGSHTMAHINVADTPADVFAEDCQRTFEVITARCGGVKHFAYPYGRFFHFNDAARESVFRAGYLSCASAERGCHVPHDPVPARENLCIRRDHVILDWKMAHTMHFLLANVRKASPVNNLFPY